MSVDPTAIEIHNDGFRMSGIARHGNTPFDMPLMSEAAENLWWGGYKDLGRRGLLIPENPILPPVFEHLISLYPWGRWDFQHDMKTEFYVQMFDDTSQTLESVWTIAEVVRQCANEGPTYVHCQAGLNRSSLITAAALFLDGFGSGEQILAHLRDVRSPAVLCNPSFAREVASW